MVFYKDTKIGQGRENAKQFLKENPDIFAEVERQVRIKYKLIEDDIAASEEESAKEKDTKSKTKKK